MANDEIATVATSKALAEAAIPEGTGALDNVPWLLDELEEAEGLAKYWSDRVEGLKDLVRRVAGDHTELKLNNKVVYTYEGINRLRGEALKKDHPDIYQAYSDIVSKSEFNLALFRSANPEMFAQYQTRVLKKKT